MTCAHVKVVRLGHTLNRRRYARQIFHDLGRPCSIAIPSGHSGKGHAKSVRGHRPIPPDTIHKLSRSGMGKKCQRRGAKDVLYVRRSKYALVPPNFPWEIRNSLAA